MTSYRVELAPLPCTVYLNGLSKVKIGSEGEKEVMIKKEGTQQDRQSVPFFHLMPICSLFGLVRGNMDGR